MCNGINNRKRNLAVDPVFLHGIALEQRQEATAPTRASSSHGIICDDDRHGEICISASASKRKKQEERYTSSRYLRIGHLPMAPHDDERLNPETLLSFLNVSMQKNKLCDCGERPVLNCLVLVHDNNGAVAFVGLESEEMAVRALDLHGIVYYHDQALAITLPKPLPSQLNSTIVHP